MSAELPVTTYVRIYSDASGETHFDNVVVSITSSAPAPPLLMAGTSEAGLVTSWRFRNDLVEGWHPAPVRQFFVLLSDEIEAQVSDGETRRYGHGWPLRANRDQAAQPVREDARLTRASPSSTTVGRNANVELI